MCPNQKGHHAITCALARDTAAKPEVLTTVNDGLVQYLKRVDRCGGARELYTLILWKAAQKGAHLHFTGIVLCRPMRGHRIAHKAAFLRCVACRLDTITKLARPTPKVLLPRTHSEQGQRNSSS